MQPLAWHCYATRSWRCGWRHSAAAGDAEMLEYGDSLGYVKGAQIPVNISWHKGFPQWPGVHSSRMVKNHSARKDNFQYCMSSPVRFSIANPGVWEVDWLAMIWMSDHCQVNQLYEELECLANVQSVFIASWGCKNDKKHAIHMWWCVTCTSETAIY